MRLSIAIDWDSDGDVDLVVGDEDGRTLIENTGLRNDSSFKSPVYFQQQADTLKSGLATPVGFDWDSDGVMTSCLGINGLLRCLKT